MTATPSTEAAQAMGATGAKGAGFSNFEAERLAFEAWMRGHSWAYSDTWNGSSYEDDPQYKGQRDYVDPLAMDTRRLWAAWRDRAALAGGLARGALPDLVMQVMGHNHGGIFKRIDENRELLELLQREAPALLAKQPWVVGWLASQDGFLCDLASVAQPLAAQFPKRGDAFPRPWPSTVVA